MHLIGQLKVKTLIIVPNTYMLKQWVQILSELFPNNTIGEYYSKKKTDGDIVVSIINSCLSKSFPFNKVNKIDQPELTIKEYYSRFDFVILDECHMYCTKTFGEVFYRIQSTYMLGLSATPDERLDGFDLMAQYHLGDIIDAELIENYSKVDVKFNSNVKIIKYDGPDEYTQNVINVKNNMINVPQMISNFIIDDKRNQLIVNETIRLLNKKHNIFIFSDRRGHLELLSELLNDAINSNYQIILYGGSSDDDIQVAQDNSKIILTTYQYSSTGVSISKLDALILATPRRNGLTQIIGRIHRLDERYQDKKRQIIDIVDNKTVLKFQYNTRKKAYEKRGCKIKTKTINHTEIVL
jgi:superfamily II DNA or RNA helicase